MGKIMSHFIKYFVLFFLRAQLVPAQSTTHGDSNLPRNKRSTLLPKLQLTASYKKVTPLMSYGDSYEYHTEIKHQEGSMAEGRGIHVVWMLTPFLSFDSMITWEGPKPLVTLLDDSVTFFYKELFWMQETKFSFNVTLDKNKTLHYGKHNVNTYVHFYWYKDYTMDSSGKVSSKGVVYSQSLTTLHFEFRIPGCSGTLGMKSKAIEDFQITASSSYAENQPSQAREDDDAWCAAQSNTDQYLQVDFPYKTIINRITTYGRRSKFHWTTKYYVQWSSDEMTWHNYTENGFKKEFQANIDRLTPKTHWLRQPIETNHFRIRPLTWNKDLICMRFELFGCKIPGSPKKCIVPLGLESGEISDAALTQSTDTTSTVSRPADGRLNKPVSAFPNGWRGSITKEDYLQIDFGTIKKLTSIAIQGGYNMPYYVTKVKLSYSNNTLGWSKYKVNGMEQELLGPTAYEYAKYPLRIKIVRPFVARHLRIIPTAFAILKIMRAEVYGCSVEEVPPENKFPGIKLSRRSIILDPVSDLLFVCMYTAKRDDSSCLSTSDGKLWNVLQPQVTSVVAASPTDKTIFGLDRSMNFLRSTDRGETWESISKEYFERIRAAHALTMATAVPDNTTSTSPTPSLSIISSKGTKFGASGSGVHVMTAGTSSWEIAGSWRCCGL